MYRALSARTDATCHVVLRSREGADVYHDDGFGESFKWDVPLLDGYSFECCDVPRAGWRNQIKAFGRVFVASFSRDFDVVLVNGYRSAESLAGILAAEVRRRAWFLATDAAKAGADDYPPPLRQLARLAYRLAVRRAAGVACMSAASEAFALALGARLTMKRTAAINTDIFLASTHLESSPPGRLKVVAVSRMLSWKRLDLLIDAVAHVPGVSLRLVGAGPHLESLQRHAAHNENVTFVGMKMQRQLPDEYYEADVLAIASDHEPFGVVAVEAAACGTPLVADRSAGAAWDLIDELGAGWVVDHPADWPSTLRMLRDSHVERVEARRAAFQAATAFYPEAVAARFVELFRQGERRR
ncbi:MAG: glycosyltransferase family 4 protein [Acidimicrobiales bacterium]|nr:glycosyltransferase family 4 protein [Acidimicrobiales bacterium]